MSMALTFDPSALLTQLYGIGTRAPQAIKRAMTRSVSSAKVAMARDIASDTGLKVGTVKDELKTEVVPGEGFGVFVGRLSISGKRIPLIDFSAKGPEPSRGRGRGVTANTGGGRKTYAGAFITTMASGHRGVFKREGPGARRSRGAWSKNLPIVELKGPSLPQVFTKKSTVAIARFQEQFPKELQREVSFVLSKGPASP